ncbi:MAG TPA: hypothetical protein VFV38_01405 [Ktedonobacteraceae bacterium]|nr:hypothetical protein [Ktedonobacteraceae bacterium]
MRGNSQIQAISDAFNSMSRTDYISLNDIGKLNSLAEYYVDYFGYLAQILAESDQLIIGRRGTGKTTLLYRALVECMRSWGETAAVFTKSRTLGIYVDLAKCQSIHTNEDTSFEQLEHTFVSEICDIIKVQMVKLWPELSKDPGIFARLFQAAESKNIQETRKLLARFTELLMNGVPRFVDNSGPVQLKTSKKANTSHTTGIQGSLGLSGANLQANFANTQEDTNGYEQEIAITTTYRLMITDILRLLDDLKATAKLSAIYIFIDEYSSLPEPLQRRFTTLLRKFLGTHAGVFVKLCAITDNYTLGSSIILQRDLFEISLDFDAYVERSGTLKNAMESLKEQAKSMVTSRLKAYQCPTPAELFDRTDEVWTLLSRSAMGVPRTLGVVLQQAWYRAQSSQSKHITIRDIDFGIQHASKAYLDQVLGAAKGGIAMPEIIGEVWKALLQRAQAERNKSSRADKVSASHFMILPEHEPMLRQLRTSFAVHLLSTSESSKADRTTRSLYCFDYGVCEANRLSFSSDAEIYRRDRFVYDDTLVPFEKFFTPIREKIYHCSAPGCNKTFKESDLFVAGIFLRFCPIHGTELVLENAPTTTYNFTEEEAKIIGAIRSARKADRKFARQIADDVGCYVQKVSMLGIKLEKEHLAQREKDPVEGKYIYFGES